MGRNAKEHRVLPLTFPRHGSALRVLCLGAHADDIEIGCGATVLELVGQGAHVSWAVFSGDDQRAEEAARSARLFLGPTAGKRLVQHRFRDAHFPAEFAGIKESCEALAALRPDVVFTHFRDDRHQDHRVLSDLAWNTFRRHTVLEYEVPKWDGDLSRPNLFVPLPARAARRKVTLISRAFASQRSKDWFAADVFLGLMRLRGMECRARSGFAEAFYARKLVLQP